MIEHFQNYIGGCRRLIYELVESLSEEEKNHIKTYIESIGEDAYTEIYWGRQEDIEAYILATKAKREKTKKWQDISVKPLLVLMSIHYLQRAEICMLSFDKGLNLTAHTSHRNMAVIAGRGFHETLKAKFDFWVF